MTDNNTYFGSGGLRPFIGKVVKFDAQRELVSGQSWGWRYKVRIVGDFSDKDSVDDGNVVTAAALLPTTSGTGGGGRTAPVRLAQGDMVLGAFLAPNNGFPVILMAFPRTKSTPNASSKKKDPTTKFGIDSGFVGKMLKGLTEGYEFSGHDDIITPIIETLIKKGSGKTKSTPKEELNNVKGGQDDENAVGATPDPKTPLTDQGEEIIKGKTRPTVEERRASRKEFDKRLEQLDKQYNGAIPNSEYDKAFEETLGRGNNQTNNSVIQQVAIDNGYAPDTVVAIVESDDDSYDEITKKLEYDAGKEFQNYLAGDDGEPPYKLPNGTKNPDWVEWNKKESELVRNSPDDTYLTLQ